MAGGVAGGADHAQGGVAETHFGQGVQVEVRRGHRADLHAEDRTARRCVVQQEPVLRREGEGDAVALFEVLDAQRVVEMAVGVDRHDGFQPVLGDEVVQCGIFARVAVSGVDDDALFGVVPDDVGVFLYRIELQAGDFHNDGCFNAVGFAKIVFFTGFYLSL